MRAALRCFEVVKPKPYARGYAYGTQLPRTLPPPSAPKFVDVHDFDNRFVQAFQQSLLFDEGT